MCAVQMGSVAGIIETKIVRFTLLCNNLETFHNIFNKYSEKNN